MSVTYPAEELVLVSIFLDAFTDKPFRLFVRGFWLLLLNLDWVFLFHLSIYYNPNANDPVVGHFNTE